jgi:hypothetical protein
VTTYLDHPVFSFKALDTWSHGLLANAELVGDASQLRSNVSQAVSEETFAMRVIQRSMAERSELREFFDGRQGMALPFWIASQVDDFEVAEPASIGASSIKVKNRAEVFGLFDITRHVVSSRTGQSLKVITATEADARANVAFNVSPVLSAALVTGDPLRRLVLVRFASDYLEIGRSSLGPEVSEARLVMVELQGETP